MPSSGRGVGFLAFGLLAVALLLGGCGALRPAASGAASSVSAGDTATGDGAMDVGSVAGDGNGGGSASVSGIGAVGATAEADGPVIIRCPGKSKSQGDGDVHSPGGDIAPDIN